VNLLQYFIWAAEFAASIFCKLRIKSRMSLDIKRSGGYAAAKEISQDQHARSVSRTAYLGYFYRPFAASTFLRSLAAFRQRASNRP
jgi:hypothetical protein